MPDFSITPQNGTLPSGQAEALSQLYVACFPDFTPWHATTFEDIAQNPINRLFIGTQNGETEGYIITQTCMPEMEILSIAINPLLHRQGLGQRLLAQVLQDAQGQRIHKVFLEVAENNTAALKLYLKNNFTLIGRRKDYYTSTTGKPAIHAVTMCRVLD